MRLQVISCFDQTSKQDIQTAILKMKLGLILNFIFILYEMYQDGMVYLIAK